MKELESFLGLVNFYRQYVPKYADLTEPFANLIKKNVEFIWSEKQQKAFDRLKVIVAKKPVVKIFDQKKKKEKKRHYVNHKCKQTFNIWNIITRRTSKDVFNQKTNEH